MSFAQLQALVSDLGKTQRLAKQGNKGIRSSLAGKLCRVKRLDCGASSETRIATLVMARTLTITPSAPSCALRPEVPWHRGKVHVVFTGKNGIRFPKDVLDQVGVPGVAVVGRLVEVDGVRGLVVDSLDR